MTVMGIPVRVVALMTVRTENSDEIEHFESDDSEDSKSNNSSSTWPARLENQKILSSWPGPSLVIKNC